MKLAVNFSEPLLVLLKENPELPVDYIKLPTIPFPQCWTQFDRGGTYRKLLPHIAQPGILDLGHPKIEQDFNEPLITKIINLTAPPYLSTHLETILDYFPNIKDYLHYKHPLVTMELQKRIIHNIKLVKAKINIPLILENSPYYSWYGYFRMGSEPEFITGICEAGDCGLLLDIAHARISAGYFGIDVPDYLYQLPLPRVKEIHMAGILDSRVGFWDSHTMLHPIDYQLFEWVLKRTRPEVVTLEYGGYPDREWNPLDGGYVQCLRNNPNELREMIYKILAIIHRY